MRSDLEGRFERRFGLTKRLPRDLALQRGLNQPSGTNDLRGSVAVAPRHNRDVQTAISKTICRTIRHPVDTSGWWSVIVLHNDDVSNPTECNWFHW